MAEQSDSRSNAQPASDTTGASDASGIPAPSHPQPTRIRHTRRRRQPPAWAVSLAARLQSLRHFLRHGLPALLKNRRREVLTVLVSF
ncbi:MAG: hypothetical protein ACKON9_12300, partial [Planctomycetaceae bacterium]